LDGDGRFLLGDFVVTHNTVVACAIIARMQVPALVLVHKEFLVNQWKERIAQFLPEAQIGIVQQDRCEYQGKHVAIGMMHSVAGRDYGQKFRDWPGLIIADELHRLSAETWSVIPSRFRARWRLGISATPRRKDGAENVFHYHLGRPLFVAKEKRMTAKVRRVWTRFKLVKTERFNPNLASRAILLKHLTQAENRNNEIVQQLMSALKAGRKVLVLSERLKHLSLLDDLLQRTWIASDGPKPSIGYYVGGMKEEELDEAAEAQVIFATAQFASEALDIPALDTLFLASPLSDVEQATGRILRPHPGKKDPVVVDFVDLDITQFARMAEGREAFYKRQGWM
jgi:superfamily II DNA or RNA helicase